MKILLYGDTHFSQSSSVIIGSSSSLEGRLQYLINSFEWMYSKAKEYNVDCIIDLGDLSDSPRLTASEITGITRALKYNQDIPEYHLLGNHERQTEDGTINSVNFIDLLPNHHLIKETKQLNNEITFVPYREYVDGDLDDIQRTHYAFSHIDIFGANVGGWALKAGMSPEYLLSKFDIVINGHIHNHSYVVDTPLKKIINLGSISGQNFSSKGTPHIGLLDTETDELSFIDNPHGLSFYNETCNSISDIIKASKAIGETGRKVAVQIKVPMNLVEDARRILNNNDNILVSKIRIQMEKSQLLREEIEEIEKVNTSEGGFNKLRDFVNAKKKLPFDRESILAMVDELERNKLSS